MQPIFLIGFMGSGKTTLGRALAAACVCRRFVDLDQLIEEREGMSVREIFATHGESYFRRRESELLRECAQADTVIACGGGTPCQADNMEWMNRHGLTVLLEASHAALLRRLIAGQAQRPLLADLSHDQLSAYIKEKIAERRPWYGQALTTFDSDRLETPEEIAITCEKFQDLINNYRSRKVSGCDK